MDSKNIKLENGKVYDLVFRNIVDQRTTEVILFKFFFLNTSRYNSLDCYKCSIYYYLGFIL